MGSFEEFRSRSPTPREQQQQQQQRSPLPEVIDVPSSPASSERPTIPGNLTLLAREASDCQEPLVDSQAETLAASFPLASPPVGSLAGPYTLQREYGLGDSLEDGTQTQEFMARLDAAGHFGPPVESAWESFDGEGLLDGLGDFPSMLTSNFSQCSPKPVHRKLQERILLVKYEI